MNTTYRESALQCWNIHKHLGEGESRVHVLCGVDLTLERSNTYAVVGPSGCGKSTLLYLLGLLDRPDRGQIFIRGQNMDEKNDNARTQARNKYIGFVFQFHFLLSEFTAAENVMLPMKKLGELSQDEMRACAEGLLDDVGLSDKYNRLATQLSGGEQQRVAVARSLANNPVVLLADEPTGNLDVKNSTLVFDLLYELAHEKGQAVLMVTHNPDIAKRCDHVLHMRDGEFLED